jgi:hypothetical protein
MVDIKLNQAALQRIAQKAKPATEKSVGPKL